MRRLLSNLPWLRWFFQTKGKRILGLSDEPLVQAQEWIQKNGGGLFGKTHPSDVE